jgi:hypothetical protein
MSILILSWQACFYEALQNPYTANSPHSLAKPSSSRVSPRQTSSQPVEKGFVGALCGAGSPFLRKSPSSHPGPEVRYGCRNNWRTVSVVLWGRMKTPFFKQDPEEGAWRLVSVSRTIHTRTRAGNGECMHERSTWATNHGCEP